MIIAAIIAAYIVGYLLTARWMYTTAIKGGHEIKEPGDAAFLGMVCLIACLVWPLALLAVLALRFVTRSPKGGSQ